jgi:iron complex outermembrane receptor protein
VQDDLPVFQFAQASARYYGFEGEISVKLAEVGDYTLNLDGVGDYTRATIAGGGPVPRIPPLRLLGGLEAQSDKIDARAEVEWTADQNRVAAFETPTKGYTLVNASLAWHPRGKRDRTSIVLSANNVFDVEARRHASFLKDFAPLAGRDIRVSARFAL